MSDPGSQNPELPAIEAVLFDLGGVLVRLGGPAVFRSWSQNSLSDAEIRDLWLDSPAIRAFERGHIETAEFGRRMVDEFDSPLEPDDLLKSFSNFILGLYPGIPDLLRAIRPGIRRACLSNTNALHWDRIWRDFGLETLLDAFFVSHLIGEAKPDAAAFERAIEGLELQSDRILYLDDLPRNVEAGRALGLQAEVVCGDSELEVVLRRYRVLS